MGRKSKEHREKREGKDIRNDRAGQLEEELKRLMDGDAVIWASGDCPPEVRQTNMEDILAFESVGSGTSLFDGLQAHGIDLPHPDKLDEEQSLKKVAQVMLALEELRIFLVGFQNMSPREFYSTLWNETLWEGCYVKKRNPGALTVIDISHSIPKSEILKMLDEAVKAGSIQ